MVWVWLVGWGLTILRPGLKTEELCITSLLRVRSPKFKIAHEENGCLEDLFGGKAYVQGGTVSFREGFLARQKFFPTIQFFRGEL